MQTANRDTTTHVVGTQLQRCSYNYNIMRHNGGWRQCVWGESAIIASNTYKDVDTFTVKRRAFDTNKPLTSKSLLIDTLVECCFTSTETVGLYGHLDFHTAPELR